MILVVTLVVLAAACEPRGDAPATGAQAVTATSTTPTTRAQAVTATSTTTTTATTIGPGFALGTVSSVPDGDRTFDYHVAVLDVLLLNKSGQIARTDYERFRCGGSLVDARHVLTAGHCLVDRGRVTTPSSDLRIVLGRKALRSGNGIMRRVRAVKIHPRYGRRRSDRTYDVAVLTLTEPVTGITPVRLVGPGDHLTRADQPVSLTGWGEATGRIVRDRKDAHIRNRLKAAHTTIALEHDCPFEDGSVVHATKLLLCLYGGKGLGLCYGDSGGPIVAWVAGRPVQVGVIKSGSVCDAWIYGGAVTNLAAPSIRSFVQSVLR
jgi:secreted trypsin-like serine protease